MKRVRRHRHRRGPRGMRGGLRRGAPGRARRRLHAVGRHRRAHAVQSGGRRHREGPSRAGDRCPRRLDGSRHRRDRHSVQAAQSKPRSCCLVAACAGRQEGLRPLGEDGARSRTEHRMDRRESGTHSRRERARRGPRHGRRRRVRMSRAGGDHGDIPERADSHRPGAAARRANGRAAVERAGRVAQVDWIRVGPSEDGDAAAAGSREHRFRAPGGARRFSRRTGRRSAGALLLSFATFRAAADRLSPPAYQRSRPRPRARQHRSIAVVQRTDSGHRPALLPVARGQDRAVPRQGASPDFP